MWVCRCDSVASTQIVACICRHRGRTWCKDVLLQRKPALCCVLESCIEVTSRNKQSASQSIVVAQQIPTPAEKHWGSKSTVKPVVSQGDSTALYASTVSIIRIAGGGRHWIFSHVSLFKNVANFILFILNISKKVNPKEELASALKLEVLNSTVLNSFVSDRKHERDQCIINASPFPWCRHWRDEL